MKRHARGFTIIEIMVVVAIIVILVAVLVAVGNQVKTSSAVRATRLELKSLKSMMGDYLSAGNPEPSLTPPNADITSTNPQSDATRWVKGFTVWFQNNGGGKMNAYKMISTADPDGGQTFVFVDSFGKNIRYVPYNAAAKREGYFWSSGPDGVFGAGTSGNSDDIYSTDP